MRVRVFLFASAFVVSSLVGPSASASAIPVKIVNLTHVHNGGNEDIAGDIRSAKGRCKRNANVDVTDPNTTTGQVVSDSTGHFAISRPYVAGTWNVKVERGGDLRRHCGGAHKSFTA